MRSCCAPPTFTTFINDMLHSSKISMRSPKSIANRNSATPPSWIAPGCVRVVYFDRERIGAGVPPGLQNRREERKGVSLMGSIPMRSRQNICGKNVRLSAYLPLLLCPLRMYACWREAEQGRERAFQQSSAWHLRRHQNITILITPATALIAEPVISCAIVCCFRLTEE